VKEQGYYEINVKDLMTHECERRTYLGCRLLAANATGRQYTLDMYVNLITPIIWSGHENRNKFVLVGFPNTPEEVQCFERDVCNLKAIIMATDGGNLVDVRNNDSPSCFNIDSMFQKQFRLKQMSSWDFAKFQEHLGTTVSWGIVTARPYAGRTAISGEIASITNSKIINWDSFVEGCKKRLKDPEADEFEGEVPAAEVQKDICAFINANKGSGCGFVFDGLSCK